MFEFSPFGKKTENTGKSIQLPAEKPSVETPQMTGYKKVHGIERLKGVLAVFDEVVYKMEENGNRFLNYKTRLGHEYTIKQIINNFLETSEGESYIMSEGQDKAAMKLTSFIINLQDTCIARNVLNTEREGVNLTEGQLNEILNKAIDTYGRQVDYAKTHVRTEVGIGDPHDPKTWKI